MRGLTSAERDVLKKSPLGFCTDEEWHIAEQLGERGLVDYRDDPSCDEYIINERGRLALYLDAIAARVDL